ncbi:hypothetical protein [Marinilactibacillus psychrotolerans]|nr:hypothetical protein [Marinilactibacillus psychrotolerans]
MEMLYMKTNSLKKFVIKNFAAIILFVSFLQSGSVAASEVVSKKPSENIDKNFDDLNSPLKSVVYKNIASDELVRPMVKEGESGMYLIRTKKSSFNENFANFSFAVTTLSGLFNLPGSFFTGIGSFLGSKTIKNVWYTERTYSDKKSYRPTYRYYTQYYKDPARTQYIGYSDGYLPTFISR